MRMGDWRFANAGVLLPERPFGPARLGLVHISFPLTPAFSRREREHERRLVSKAPK